MVSDQVYALNSLLEFSDYILQLLEEKKVAIATFMDVSKAFDGRIIIFYSNSNDRSSMQLHCNGSMATYQTVNILSVGTGLTHLH